MRGRADRQQRPATQFAGLARLPSALEVGFRQAIEQFIDGGTAIDGSGCTAAPCRNPQSQRQATAASV
jgi:hypothetical protein